jgi:hypothetical protein
MTVLDRRAPSNVEQETASRRPWLAWSVECPQRPQHPDVHQGRLLGFSSVGSPAPLEGSHAIAARIVLHLSEAESFEHRGDVVADPPS